MKKKSPLLTVLLLLISFQLIANSLDQEKKIKEHYEKQLFRFDCNFISNIKTPQWVCNKKSPIGWGKFYGNKLDEIKSKRIYANNR